MSDVIDEVYYKAMSLQPGPTADTHRHTPARKVLFIPVRFQPNLNFIYRC